MLRGFGIFPEDVETIPPVPSYDLPTHFPPPTIHASREHAVAAANDLQDDAIVHSDGSAHDGHVGAAAILTRRGQPAKSLQYYLGEEADHTVYEAELTGLLLGAHVVRCERRPVASVTFAADNQAAPQAPHRSRARSGYAIVDGFVGTLHRVEDRQGPLPIASTWTPGHEGIAGNELADGKAKSAATGNSSSNNLLPRILRRPLPSNAAALRRHHKAQIQHDSLRIWRASKRYAHACYIDEKMKDPQRHFLKRIRPLSRAQASLLFQLRTGHVPLNKHLHRIKRSDSPTCPLCHEEDETGLHFLLECPSLGKHRYHLSRAGAIVCRSVPLLLSRAKSLFYLFNCITATERFPTFDVSDTSALGPKRQSDKTS